MAGLCTEQMNEMQNRCRIVIFIKENLREKGNDDFVEWFRNDDGKTELSKEIKDYILRYLIDNKHVPENANSTDLIYHVYTVASCLLYLAYVLNEYVKPNPKLLEDLAQDLFNNFHTKLRA